jgi:hypothetical protein
MFSAPPPMQKRRNFIYATMTLAKSSSKPFVLPNLLFLAISSMVITVANAYNKSTTRKNAQINIQGML